MDFLQLAADQLGADGQPAQGKQRPGRSNHAADLPLNAGKD